MGVTEETILTRRIVHHGRVMDFEVYEVRLPDGRTAQRDIVTHPGAVAIAALDADGQVLLVRQYRTAAARTLLEIPAGTLHPGEDPLLAAARELREETGFAPGKLESLGGIFVAPGYTSEYIHLYLATDLSAAPLPMDDDEFIALERLPLDEALAAIESGAICDAKSVTALLRLDRRQRHP
jgi:ADP-ribose pyrophosphatase